MTHAAPLPPSLAGRPFAVADAARDGVTAGRLRSSDLVMPTRGVRAPHSPVPIVPPEESATERQQRLRDDVLRRAELYAPALTPRQFFSHDTGLAVIEAPLPFSRASALDLHISARRPAGIPRRAGTVGHRLPAREPATGIARGLRIEHPMRLWHQVGDVWELDYLIAAADFLVHRGIATLDELAREVAVAGDSRDGIRRRALQRVRIGAESARETQLRLAMRRAGLPEPTLQYVLTDAGGTTVARLDTAFVRYRVAAEYDGRQHAEGDQFVRDADRWDAIRACGWDHVRILGHHLYPDPQVATDKVATALLAAGWRPGRP